MTDKKRRQFVTFMGAATVAVPVSAVITSLPSHATDLPMLDETAANAAALQYKAVSEVEGQNCVGCALYQGAPDSEAGPCPLFQGTNVHANGWCSAFAPKPS